jgi:hypothetical protein
MTETTTNDQTDPKVCTRCAHWTCSSCGWRRPNANRHYPQDCANCGGRAGEFTPTRHQQARTAERHAQEAAEHDELYGDQRIELTPDQLELLTSLGPVIYAARRDQMTDYATGLPNLAAAVRQWVKDHPEADDAGA